MAVAKPMKKTGADAAHQLATATISVSIMIKAALLLKIALTIFRLSISRPPFAILCEALHRGVRLDSNTKSFLRISQRSSQVGQVPQDPATPEPGGVHARFSPVLLFPRISIAPGPIVPVHIQYLASPVLVQEVVAGAPLPEAHHFSSYNSIQLLVTAYGLSQKNLYKMLARSAYRHGLLY